MGWSMATVARMHYSGVVRWRSRHTEDDLSIRRETTTSRGEVHALELQITSELDAIDEVNARFNAFAGAHRVPDGARRSFNIALDDLLNNIVSYAYGGSPDHVIDVQIEVAPESLAMAIFDDGPMYDPFAKDAPDTSTDLDERELGGLGVHLVRSLMDEVSYERQDDRNVVIIKKYLSNDEPGVATPTGVPWPPQR